MNEFVQLRYMMLSYITASPNFESLSMKVIYLLDPIICEQKFIKFTISFFDFTGNKIIDYRNLTLTFKKKQNFVFARLFTN